MKVSFLYVEITWYCKYRFDGIDEVGLFHSEFQIFVRTEHCILLFECQKENLCTSRRPAGGWRYGKCRRRRRHSFFSPPRTYHHHSFLSSPWRSFPSWTTEPIKFNHTKLRNLSYVRLSSHLSIQLQLYSHFDVRERQVLKQQTYLCPPAAQSSNCFTLSAYAK